MRRLWRVSFLSCRDIIPSADPCYVAMPPEEAANTPPPKRRRRGRTSPVVEKITYTCHHAGSYSSKHSDLLPKSKLRLNTKTSVKCGCLARIVMNEVEGGDVRVTYYWQHQGHGEWALYRAIGQNCERR
jgi:hypothetical protein